MNEIRRIGDPASAERVRAIVSGQELPSIVDRFTLDFGYDSVDDPAVWIVLHAQQLPTDPIKAIQAVEEVDLFSRVVREHILDNELGVFPYFQITSEPQEVIGD